MCNIATPECLLIRIKGGYFSFLHFLSIKHQDTKKNKGHNKSSAAWSPSDIIIIIISNDHHSPPPSHNHHGS